MLKTYLSVYHVLLFSTKYKKIVFKYLRLNYEYKKT